MKKKLVLILLLILTLNCYSETLSFSFSTGDSDLDVTLNDMNNYISYNIDDFSIELSSYSGVSKREITGYIKIDKMQPAEVYYAVEIAKIKRIPLKKVIIYYRINRERGWGYISKHFGLKPGGREFIEIKKYAKERKTFEYKRHERKIGNKEFKRNNEKEDKQDYDWKNQKKGKEYHKDKKEFWIDKKNR